MDLNLSRVGGGLESSFCSCYSSLTAYSEAEYKSSSSCIYIMLIVHIPGAGILFFDVVVVFDVGRGRSWWWGTAWIAVWYLLHFFCLRTDFRHRSTPCFCKTPWNQAVSRCRLGPSWFCFDFICLFQFFWLCRIWRNLRFITCSLSCSIRGKGFYWVGLTRFPGRTRLLRRLVCSFSSTLGRIWKSFCWWLWLWRYRCLARWFIRVLVYLVSFWGSFVVFCRVMRPVQVTLLWSRSCHLVQVYSWWCLDWLETDRFWVGSWRLLSWLFCRLRRWDIFWDCFYNFRRWSCDRLDIILGFCSSCLWRILGNVLFLLDVVLGERTTEPDCSVGGFIFWPSNRFTLLIGVQDRVWALLRWDWGVTWSIDVLLEWWAVFQSWVRFLWWVDWWFCCV